ncbi:tRNA A64-2'-O-ribosylphosphate transferase [Podospora didyma]|uniref:tRNA A64-2'-O-ribosylphosphate transferase n=1 Tax=Podospora didyma TaxID=330526 RepID=A0AAE0NCK7_9PEZI|nr:tRNA A64-2'-O-ribosylphosphate transferase [Podospora didyma]
MLTTTTATTGTQPSLPPLGLADVIFPSSADWQGEGGSTLFSRILGDLKRANLSVANRLRSIRHDASFVAGVASELNNLPLVANERCGGWYIDPAALTQRKKASAYFKSTDGHTGQWKFSTRRLNLNLLEVVARDGGCIIVDSTRRGKRMPDSLSKTVPVWCCVLNRALFPENPECHALHVPPNVVSDSEKSQMEARLPEFLKSFQALDIDLAPLQKQLTKPLRPLWIAPPQDDDDHNGGGLSRLVVDKVSEKFYPVVCCTASSRRVGAGAEELSGTGYVQGAGDDTENWALGLTAQIFWQHADELLDTPDSDLPDLIKRLVVEFEAGEANAVSELRSVVRPYLFVGTLSAGRAALQERNTCVVTLSSSSSSAVMATAATATATATEPESSWIKSPFHMEVALGRSKAASRMLRQALPQICEFVSRYLMTAATYPEENKNVAIVCDSGRDLSVGVALAVYCWCFDASGNLFGSSDDAKAKRGPFIKTAIRVKLGQIMTAVPDANPSRATLQSVNSFLMGWRI